MTVDRLDGLTVGAQYGSPAFWYLQDQLGEQWVKGFSTLVEPLQKVAGTDLPFAAGDAVIGAYIARDTYRVTYGHDKRGRRMIRWEGADGRIWLTLSLESFDGRDAGADGSSRNP